MSSKSKSKKKRKTANANSNTNSSGGSKQISNKITQNNLTIENPSVCGISFGMRNICIAITKNGCQEVVVNPNGDRITPAYLLYEDNSAENAKKPQNGIKPILGQEAFLSAMRDNPNSLHHFLDRTTISGDWNFRVKQTPSNKDGNEILFEINTERGNRLVTCLEALVAILTEVREIASCYLNQSVNSCIISHSSCQLPSNISLLRNAALQAHMPAIQILPQAVLSLLSYGIGQKECDLEHDKLILVFDMGHTLLEIGLYRAKHGLYQEISSASNNDCSGTNLDILLTNYVAKQFSDIYKIDITNNKKILRKISLAIPLIKQTLSKLPNVDYYFESLIKDIDFNFSISRTKFEGLCSPLINQAIEIMKDFISRHSIPNDTITDLVCVGGCCHIPLVISRLQAAIPSSLLHSSISADEVVAIGAAKQGEILMKNNLIEKIFNSFGPSNEVPCLTEDIVLKIGDVHQIVLFPLGTPIPYEITCPQISVPSGEKISFTLQESIMLAETTFLIPHGVAMVDIYGYLTHSTLIVRIFTDSMLIGELVIEFTEN